MHATKCIVKTLHSGLAKHVQIEVLEQEQPSRKCLSGRAAAHGACRFGFAQVQIFRVRDWRLSLFRAFGTHEATKSSEKRGAMRRLMGRVQRELRLFGKRRVVSRRSMASSSSESLAFPALGVEAPPKEAKFLVRNSRNDVKRFRCFDDAELREAMEGLRSVPHLCVGGVSNAGKSSMINHLLAKKNIAMASSVAGKTKSVDLFLVNDQFVLTDFPGLPSRDGQVDGMWRGKWRNLIRAYLENAEDLRSFLFIHDARWPVTPEEKKFVLWIDKFKIPNYILLLSKDDKIDHNRRIMGLNNVKNKLNWTGKHLHYCSDNASAPCRRSRRQLLRYIERVVGFAPPDCDVESV